MLTVTEYFRQQAPHARIGILALDQVTNPSQDSRLDQQKQAIESDLRRQYSSLDRQALRSLPTLLAYHQFYRRFDKTYHVQLQLESILFKGRSIPSVAALVEAMFMAELKNFLLTAGHDLDAVRGSLYADIAQGGEQFIQLNGSTAQLKPGDMFIWDESGILSSVLYGPDQRTAISTHTTRAIFTVYAPDGISTSQVQAHLSDIAAYVSLFAPAMQLTLQSVLP